MNIEYSTETKKLFFFKDEKFPLVSKIAPICCYMYLKKNLQKDFSFFVDKVYWDLENNGNNFILFLKFDSDEVGENIFAKKVENGIRDFRELFNENLETLMKRFPDEENVILELYSKKETISQNIINIFEKTVEENNLNNCLKNKETNKKIKI